MVDEWDPLRLIYYDQFPQHVDIENNGHSATVTFSPDDCYDRPQVDHFFSSPKNIVALKYGQIIMYFNMSTR